MPLVAEAPEGYAPIQDPPTRFDLDGVAVPPNVDLTLVGTIHDGSCSTADYAADLFATNYLALMESYSWDDKGQKRLQRVSRGYSNALEESQAIELADIEEGSPFPSKNARWNLCMTEALYKSGVRIMMADMSAEDIAAGRWASPFVHMSAVSAVTGNAVNGRPVAEQDLVVFAERDTAIIRAICEAIPKLRREDPKLDAEETLKAVGLYGMWHVPGISDALAALAAEQGVNTFSVETQYEVAVPDLEGGVSAIELEGRKVQMARMLQFYSNWLRTEPVEPDHLWTSV
ncbi:MAG TPA: hypothetical protein VFX84_01885 [Candidatus Saccharimonadales bacterium]|nr:hypothetical protein [Candidatus Saccharimonadales bacterium]